MINDAADYALNWHKNMTIDNVTIPLSPGQMVSHGATVALLKPYGLMDDSNATTVQLNRPLELALANNDRLYVGPPGEYGFAFHPNAVALITRPLALPASSAGALGAVVNFNGLSIRVVITYDGDLQGHRVTLDLLCGVKTLDTDLGSVLLG